jgi:hypothetical protein
MHGGKASLYGTAGKRERSDNGGRRHRASHGFATNVIAHATPNRT